MKPIEEQIQQKIDELTSLKGIEPLLAIESGSRAWGFASPDSDYDVRCMYLKPLPEYLRLDPAQDTLSFPVDAVFDVVGWDLRKVLLAIKKSNATPFEWLQSPITYRMKGDFKAELWELAQGFFNPKSLLYHYKGLAAKSHEAAHAAEVGVVLKKYFYVLRPLLAAKWIRERDTVPPMEFQSLRETIAGDKALERSIDELLAQKATANEKAVVPAHPIVEQFIKEESQAVESAAATVPARTGDIRHLNAFFQRQFDL